MPSMTDSIEMFIKKIMGNNATIQIKRNELANLFNCAPSQINYVLTTRFTIDRGYYIESKKGGGGYIQITRIHLDEDDNFQELIKNKIGKEISFKKSKELLEYLEVRNFINKRELKIILYSIDDKVLCTPICEIKDKIRASILQNIMIRLLNVEEW